MESFPETLGIVLFSSGAVVYKPEGISGHGSCLLETPDKIPVCGDAEKVSVLPPPGGQSSPPALCVPGPPASWALPFLSANWS